MGVARACVMRRRDGRDQDLPFVWLRQEPAQFHPLRLVRPEDGSPRQGSPDPGGKLERRYQQEGISIQWLAIAFAVQGVLTAALVFGLPMVIPAIDLEGGNGMTVCIPVWFVGGMLVG